MTIYNIDYYLDIASRRRDLLDKIASEHTGPGEIIPLTLDHSDKQSIQSAVEEISKKVRFNGRTCGPTDDEVL